MFKQWRSVGRVQAAGIHLTCSVALALLTAWLVFGVWYPWPFDSLSGGAQLFTLLVSVDVVLGPLLTMVVFSPAKPQSELARDLSIIVVLQLAAMVYGVHAMAVARPAVIALEIDRFRVVSALSVQEAEFPSAPQALRSLSWRGPRLVNTRAATGEERLGAVQMAMAGVDLGMRPSFWLPWDDAARVAVKRAAKPAAALAQGDPAAARVLTKAAEDIGRPLEQLVYLPILARRSDWVALLDRSSGELLGYAPVNGF